MSLWVFLLKHLQSQGHLFCWYLLFSMEQTRYLQEDGGSEIYLDPVSTTDEVFFIDLWIQNVFVCAPEVPGQMVEALSFQTIFGWSSQFCVEQMTGSLRIFSIWVRTLNVLRSSKGSGSALFSISLICVVFIAPTMARSTFWTLSSLLGPGGCGILHNGTDCSCIDPSQDVCVSSLGCARQFCLGFFCLFFFSQILPQLLPDVFST